MEIILASASLAAKLIRQAQSNLHFMLWGELSPSPETLPLVPIKYPGWPPGPFILGAWHLSVPGPAWTLGAVHPGGCSLLRSLRPHTAHAQSSISEGLWSSSSALLPTDPHPPCLPEPHIFPPNSVRPPCFTPWEKVRQPWGSPDLPLSPESQCPPSPCPTSENRHFLDFLFRFLLDDGGSCLITAKMSVMFSILN